MSTPAPLNSQVSPVPATPEAHGAPSCDVRGLISLAIRGLVAMLDPDRQLFCHRLQRTASGIVRDGVSPRYTVMTLLGLRELELAGKPSSFDTQTIYQSVVRDTNWIQGIGDLGLLIWLTAAFDPDRLGRLFSKFDCDAALDRYSDAREARTMELAWFLAGLAHAAETSPELLCTLTDLSVETYHRMEENQGEFGLFGHMSVKRSLAGRLRGKIGSFADQVYPIVALSKFARVFHLEDPLGPALECATAICRAQGKLGQWWWLYDSLTGRTSSRYPVYSVHQHGMAPMCLFAVEETTTQSFRQYIYKGLAWIHGLNELDANMVDADEKLIWRCIRSKKSQSKYWEMATSIIRSPDEIPDIGSLMVLHEERPYEYGWLLYAFARQASFDPGPTR
jgi:hypothetical protein